MTEPNYWLRLLGANILAAVFAPEYVTWWADLFSHVGVALGILWVTLPEREK